MYVKIVQQENTKQIHGKIAISVSHVMLVKHHQQAPTKQAIAISTNVMQERIFLAQAVKIAQQPNTKQIPRQLSQIVKHARPVKHHRQAPPVLIIATFPLVQQERTAMIGTIVSIVHLGHTKQIRRHLNQIANHVLKIQHHRQAPTQKAIASSVHVQ
tara:strand:+ start:1986 stop:2456 length:471 start_codon:yes stop_codon:yes gene_type:complete